MDLQTLNDTSGIWACLQPQNGTSNGSLEFPNGTCGDALLLPKTEPARAKGEDFSSRQTAVSDRSFKATRSRSLQQRPRLPKLILTTTL